MLHVSSDAKTCYNDCRSLAVYYTGWQYGNRWSQHNHE